MNVLAKFITFVSYVCVCVFMWFHQRDICLYVNFKYEYQKELIEESIILLWMLSSLGTGSIKWRRITIIVIPDGHEAALFSYW